MVGKINEAAETMFVKRDNKDSRNAAFNSLSQTLEQGKNVVIFPEGGCKGRRIHYEAQETFEWRAPHTVLHKMWHFMTSQNDQANFYVYDAIYPAGFSDKHACMDHVHNLYIQWQSRYLE